MNEHEFRKQLTCILFYGIVMYRISPLDSYEADVSGLSTFLRGTAMNCPDLFKGEEFKLIGERELFITFEANRPFLMSNSSMFGSNAQTTHSILRNFSMLKSRGITPADFSHRLTSLFANGCAEEDQFLFKKYKDFETIYALFDQLLQDRHLLTVNDLMLRLLNNQDVLRLLAKVYFENYGNA